MNLTPQALAILAMFGSIGTVVSLLCSVTPTATKARNPKLWTVLESLAFNSGNAQNGDGPKGNGALTTIAWGIAAFYTVFVQATTSPTPPAQVVPVPAVTFVATLPADPTATALSVAVSPAADVTP